MRLGSYMTKDQITSALAALNQALYVHEKWSDGIHSALICRSLPDSRDLSSEAHRQCQFGQWYYSEQESNLSQHPAFVAVEVEHERMHEEAAHLLEKSHAGEQVSVRDYERFNSAMTRVRAEILGLIRELDEGLTSLDPLTGATGRVSMLTRLRAELALVKRDVQTCTIAMMDLDNFKVINDDFGHQNGDLVLVETVRFIMSHLRPYDEFFRYGGEEFMLCAPGTDLATGHDLVERLREGVALLTLDGGSGRTLHFTASFGLTMLDPSVAVEESIARADQALYLAKAGGRNQTHVWQASLS